MATATSLISPQVQKRGCRQNAASVAIQAIEVSVKPISFKKTLSIIANNCKQGTVSSLGTVKLKPSYYDAQQG
jgi:hypothetical protein